MSFSIDTKEVLTGLVSLRRNALYMVADLRVTKDAALWLPVSQTRSSGSITGGSYLQTAGGDQVAEVEVLVDNYGDTEYRRVYVKLVGDALPDATYSLVLVDSNGEQYIPENIMFDFRSDFGMDLVLNAQLPIAVSNQPSVTPSAIAVYNNWSSSQLGTIDADDGQGGTKPYWKLGDLSLSGSPDVSDTEPYMVRVYEQDEDGHEDVVEVIPDTTDTSGTGAKWHIVIDQANASKASRTYDSVVTIVAQDPLGRVTNSQFRLHFLTPVSDSKLNVFSGDFDQFYKVREGALAGVPAIPDTSVDTPTLFTVRTYEAFGLMNYATLKVVDSDGVDSSSFSQSMPSQWFAGGTSTSGLEFPLRFSPTTATAFDTDKSHKLFNFADGSFVLRLEEQLGSNFSTYFDGKTDDVKTQILAATRFDLSVTNLKQGQYTTDGVIGRSFNVNSTAVIEAGEQEAADQLKQVVLFTAPAASMTVENRLVYSDADDTERLVLSNIAVNGGVAYDSGVGDLFEVRVVSADHATYPLEVEPPAAADDIFSVDREGAKLSVKSAAESPTVRSRTSPPVNYRLLVKTNIVNFTADTSVATTDQDEESDVTCVVNRFDLAYWDRPRFTVGRTVADPFNYTYKSEVPAMHEYAFSTSASTDLFVLALETTPNAGYNYALVYLTQSLPPGTEFDAAVDKELSVYLNPGSKPTSTQVYNFVSASSTDVASHSIAVKEIVFSESGALETDATKVQTSKLYDTNGALIFEEASEGGVTGKGAFNSFMMWIVFHTPVLTLNAAQAVQRVVWNDKLVPDVLPVDKDITEYTRVASPSVQHAFGTVKFYYDLSIVTDRVDVAKTRSEGFVTNVTTNVDEDENANTSTAQVMELYLSQTEWDSYKSNDYSFLPVQVRASLADFAPASGVSDTSIDTSLLDLPLSVIPVRTFSLIQITNAETDVAIRKIGTNSEIVNNARALSGKSVEAKMALVKFDCSQDTDLFDSTGVMESTHGVAFTSATVNLTAGVAGDGGSFTTEEEAGNVFTLYFNNATARATAYTSPNITYTEGPGDGRTFDVLAGGEDLFVFRELEVVVPSDLFADTKMVAGGSKTVHGVLNAHATSGVSVNLEFQYGYGNYTVTLSAGTPGAVGGVTYGTDTITADDTFYDAAAVKLACGVIQVTDSSAAHLVTNPTAGTTAFAGLGAVAVSVESNNVLDADGNSITDSVLDAAGDIANHSLLAFPPLTRLLSNSTVYEAHVDVSAAANSAVFGKQELFSGGIGFTVDANGIPTASVADYLYTVSVSSEDGRGALLAKSADGGLHVTGFAASTTVKADKYTVSVQDIDSNSLALFDNATESVVPKLQVYYFQKPTIVFTDPEQILELTDADRQYSLGFSYQGGSKLIVNDANASAYRNQISMVVKHIDDTADLTPKFVGTGGFVDAYQNLDTAAHTGTVELTETTNSTYLNKHFKASVTIPAFTHLASSTRRFVQADGTLVTASEASLWASSVAEATLFFRYSLTNPMWHLGGYTDSSVTNFYDTDAPSDFNTNVVTYMAGASGQLVDDSNNRAEDPVQKAFLPGINPFFTLNDPATDISPLDSFQLVLLQNDVADKEAIASLTYSHAEGDTNLPDNVIIEVTNSADSDTVVAKGRRITVGSLFDEPSLTSWQAGYRVHIRFSENGEEGFGGTLPDGSLFTLVLHPGIMQLDTALTPTAKDARNFLVRHSGYIQQLHIAPSDWTTSATSGGRLLSESWLDCSSWRLDYKHIALTDEATVSTSHSLTYHVKLFAMPGNSTTWVDVSQHLESVLNRSTSPNVTASFDTTGGFLRITPNSGVDANTLFLTLLYLPERFFDENVTYTTNSSWVSTNKYKLAIRGGSAVSWAFSPQFYTQRSDVTLPSADSLLQRTVSVDSSSGSLTTRATRVNVNGTDLGARFEKQLTSITGASLSSQIIDAYSSLSADGTVELIQSEYLPVVPLPGMQYKQVLVNKLIQYNSSRTNSQYTDDIPGSADTLLFFYQDSSSTTELYALRNGVSSRAKTLSSTEFISRTFTTADMASFDAPTVPHGSEVTFQLANTSSSAVFDARAKVNEDGSITVTNSTDTTGFQSGDVLEFNYNGALTVSFSYSGSSWSHAISDTARFLSLVKAIMEGDGTVSCRILRSMHASAFTAANGGSISVDNSYFYITGASKTFSSINTVYDSSNMELKLAVSGTEQLVLTLKVTPTETSVSVKSFAPNNVFEKEGTRFLFQYGTPDTVAARLRYTEGAWRISTSYAAIQAMLTAKNQIRLLYLLGENASLDPLSFSAFLRDPVPIHEIDLQEREMRDTWTMTLQSGGNDQVQFQFTRSKNNSQALQVAVSDVSGGNSRLFSGVYKMEIVKGSDRSPMISVINDDATGAWDLTMSLESGGDMFDNHDFFISQIMGGSYFFRIITNLDFSDAGPFTVKLSDLAVYDVVTGVKKSITNNFGDKLFIVGAMSVIGTDGISNLPIELAFTYTDSEGVKKVSNLYSLTASFNKQLNSYAVTGNASTPASVTYTDASGNTVTHTAYTLTGDPSAIWLRIHQLSILDFSTNPSGNVPHHWEDLYSGAYDLIDPTEDVFLNRFSVFDPNNVTLSSEVVYLKINGKDIVKKGDLTTAV